MICFHGIDVSDCVNCLRSRVLNLELSLDEATKIFELSIVHTSKPSEWRDRVTQNLLRLGWLMDPSTPGVLYSTTGKRHETLEDALAKEIACQVTHNRKLLRPQDCLSSSLRSKSEDDMRYYVQSWVSVSGARVVDSGYVCSKDLDAVRKYARVYTQPRGDGSYPAGPVYEAVLSQDIIAEASISTAREIPTFVSTDSARRGIQKILRSVSG